LLLFAAMFAVSSCNTSIGVYRDARQAYSWTKEKIQGTGGGGDSSGGAPVY
jgi:hypothetical protein